MAGIYLGGVSGRAGCRHLTCLECSDLQCREEAGASDVPVGLVFRLTSGDDGGGLGGEIYPTLAHLPGANEDARADRGRAVPVNVKLGDLAVARFRGRKAAKNGKVLGEGDTRAARGRAEDQDVRDRSGGDTELEFNRAAGVGDDKIARGIGVEPGALGRGKDGR